MGTKVEKTNYAVHGNFAEINNIINVYTKDHLYNLAGARQATKPESNIRYKSYKIKTLQGILKFLCNKSGKSHLPEVLTHIKDLGSTKDGYFSMDHKASAIKKIAVFGEFIRWTYEEDIISGNLNAKCMSSLSNLRSNLASLRSVEVAKKKEESKSKRITETDIKSFYNSNHCKKIKSLLFSKPAMISVKKRQVSSIRNLIMFQLMERNFLRPCALYHLACEPFKGASGKEEECIIPVYGDKTISSRQEASYLHISPREMEEIRNYLVYFRPAIEPIDREAGQDLFLKEDGSRLTDADISRVTRWEFISCSHLKSCVNLLTWLLIGCAANQKPACLLTQFLTMPKTPKFSSLAGHGKVGLVPVRLKEPSMPGRVLVLTLVPLVLVDPGPVGGHLLQKRVLGRGVGVHTVGY